MKMKRLLPLLLAAALLNTGCSSDEVSESVAGNEENTDTVVIDTIETDENSAPAAAPAPVTEEADTAEAEVTEETVTAEADEDKTVFPAGIWMLYEITVVDERIPVGYCFTNDDGLSGENWLFEDASGYQFEYEIGINEIFVTVDGQNVTVPVVGGDLSYTMLDIPDCGRVDMVYFSEGGKADIPEFYSNEELGELALQYYTTLYDYTPGCVGTQSNEDGTVTIQLYDSLEDHNSTSAWYRVDRWSTEGWDDITGEEINFLAALLDAE